MTLTGEVWRNSPCGVTVTVTFGLPVYVRGVLHIFQRGSAVFIELMKSIMEEDVPEEWKFGSPPNNAMRTKWMRSILEYWFSRLVSHMDKEKSTNS